MEFVALGMAAEIVVVVEDQDPGPVAVQLAVEVRRRQPAEAAADHDQVVAFIELPGLVEYLVLPRQGMCYFERARVRAAHAGEGRGVVKGARVGARDPGPGSGARYPQRQRGQPEVVDEVAPGDVPMQAEIVV